MKKYVVSVKDVCTGVFGDVCCFDNESSARRSFNHSVSSSPFRSDMQLFFVGWFDTETGELTPDLSFLQSGGECAEGVNNEK